MCYDRSNLWLAHSSVQNVLPSNALDPNRVSPAPALIQWLEPQAGASAERPAEAKPALAPASPPRATRQRAVSSRDPGTPPSGGSLRRQPRQGAVSSPRRCPNQPLLGSMWRKWLKVAAWTAAFLQSPGENKFLTVRNLITPSRSTSLPSHPQKAVWWGHRNSNPARRGSRRTVSSLSTIWRLSRFRHNCRKPLHPSG